MYVGVLDPLLAIVALAQHIISLEQSRHRGVLVLLRAEALLVLSHASP